MFEAWRWWFMGAAAAQALLFALRWLGIINWPWWALLTPVWLVVLALVAFALLMSVYWSGD